MKILVTGASGFVGSHVTRLLVERGCKVVVLLRGSSSRDWLGGLDIEMREGSLSDAGSLTRAVSGVERVVHVAGAVTAPSRELFFEHNAHGTRRLVEACLASSPGVSRFVLISSLAAGGPALDGTIRAEDDQDRPVSAYGESKLAGELALLEQRSRIPSVILRPPLVYGPRDRGVLAIAQVAARGLMPLLPGDPANPGPKRYSQIFGEDLARGIVDAVLTDCSLAPGSRYYLSSSEIVTEVQMYEAFGTALGRRLTRLTVPAWALKGLARGADLLGKAVGRSFPLNSDKIPELLAPAWTCSHIKAERELGFRATTPFDEGIRRTVEWYRSRGWVR